MKIGIFTGKFYSLFTRYVYINLILMIVFLILFPGLQFNPLEIFSVWRQDIV